ncbi:MAG: hypothetical protein A2928_00510 [Candidatus Taylorbacteria bacterium RIFCSPLOWO2_01_FULL_45_15b]|uniref:Nudix hydrolase domain-containing protein n=1 Tax=Candidatus Taylorbacteria bacterium RIFCSPLOWO2_01_FULL_45_15b TaxID=1802319 RepID=A0A1G2N7T2_9BACT|nr:MAG: hypothetical protein A2928_00510 [Candidatus Taylorbacteria bacterium RIFCSPLOWO2_01_FULL_45_15b]
MLKLLLQLAHALRCFFWWLVRPVTRGVRAILVNSGGKVLLVHHRYERGWLLPGGKTRKNETDIDALRRELKEEIGVSNISQAEKLGEYLNTYEYKKDTVAVFVVRSFTQERTRLFEIEKWSFFDPRNLPEGTSPGTRKRIEEWLGQKQISNQW